MRQIITQISQKSDTDINDKIPIGAHAENVIVKVTDSLTGEISTVSLQHFIDNLKVDGVVNWEDYL